MGRLKERGEARLMRNAHADYYTALRTARSRRAAWTEPGVDPRRARARAGESACSGAAPRLHRPAGRRRRLRVGPAHLLVDHGPLRRACGSGCSNSSARSSRSARTLARSPGSSRCGARCGSAPRRRSSPDSASACACSPRAAMRMPRRWRSPRGRPRECSCPIPTSRPPRRELNDAVERLHKLGNGWGEAITRVSLGRVAWLRGSREEALEHFERASEVAEAGGDLFTRSVARQSDRTPAARGRKSR